MSEESLSKSETVYRELRKRITDGRYVPGYRIVLAQVALELGVSVVPVREALRRLEAERLITFTRNVGAQVAAIDVSDYAESMEVLAMLEGMATALAADHLSEESLDEAAAVNDRMRQLAQGESFDPREFTMLNNRFHEIICAGCPNDHLSELLQDEWRRIAVIRRNVFAFEPVRSEKSVAEHDQILRLIREKAPFAEIEDAARRHKLRTRREFVESPPTAG
ncbi:MAG: GntR family transcriptional regulator [Propionibacteriaceae bacterium]|nr:GntR family transcriptional regulator [Propionibacteriaceae bacterium]